VAFIQATLEKKNNSTPYIAAKNLVEKDMCYRHTGLNYINPLNTRTNPIGINGRLVAFRVAKDTYRLITCSRSMLR